MLWNHLYLRRLDLRPLPIILALMGCSLLVLTSTSGSDVFFSPIVKKQLQWFAIGWGAYFFCAGLDYHTLRKWAPVLYIIALVLLLGLFFTNPIQNVRRWYRIPLIGAELQPSEIAKLAVVIAMSAFIERKGKGMRQWVPLFQASMLVLIPFVLILKQPDLGSALVLMPITLVMFYFAGIKRRVIAAMSICAMCGLVFINMMFLGFISHENFRPIATKVIKEYQYERLNPDTYHQRASQTAISVGGVKGSGWRQSEFTGNAFLPAAQTDSVFAAFAEEFGLWGVFIVLTAFFGLIYFSFQVTALAKDPFGRLLSAGIAVYLAMHVVVNIGMMCGFLPITGVPLILMTYGGSSVLATMSALGLLQSVYCRRFMFC
ncbi:MAG: rod shape-determining protein RodA [Chlamydiales bacterium]|nr:rod shape-determining protein RodA [Chlamydiales bacterium]